MKNINILLKGAAKLNKQEMKNVKGGVSREEYCATLRDIIHSREESGEDLSPGEEAGAGYGWNVANCGEFFNDVSF